MAIGWKRLIPRCMGARIVFSGALSLFFCLGIAVCQDLPRNIPVSKNPGQLAQSSLELANRQVGVAHKGI